MKPGCFHRQPHKEEYSDKQQSTRTHARTHIPLESRHKRLTNTSNACLRRSGADNQTPIRSHCAMLPTVTCIRSCVFHCTVYQYPQTHNACTCPCAHLQPMREVHAPDLRAKAHTPTDGIANHATGTGCLSISTAMLHLHLRGRPPTYPCPFVPAALNRRGCDFLAPKDRNYFSATFVSQSKVTSSASIVWM